MTNLSGYSEAQHGSAEMYMGTVWSAHPHVPNCCVGVLQGIKQREEKQEEASVKEQQEQEPVEEAVCHSSVTRVSSSPCVIFELERQLCTNKHDIIPASIHC